MTKMKQFDAALKEQWEELEKAITEEFKELVRITYDMVLQNSAVWSGYYKSNHRINFGDGDFLAELEPEQRPDDAMPGIFIANIETARTKEFGILEGLKEEDSVVSIGTAVPYARKLELRDGTYTNASAAAPAEFNARQGR